MKQAMLLPSIVVLLFVAGCVSVALKPANFAWPVERVLPVNKNGIVEDDRYMFSFNARPLLFEETGDSTVTRSVDLRVIRDGKGYYYLTARGWRNVYVFEQGDGSLDMTKKILVSERGLRDPAFNQRQTYIQLLNGSDKPRSVSPKGLVEGESQ